MRGRGFAVPVAAGGVADFASARLPYPPPCCSHAARVVRWRCIRGMQCSRLLRLPLLPRIPYPARNIAAYHVNLILPPCGRVNTPAIMRRKRDPMSSVHLPHAEPFSPSDSPPQPLHSADAHHQHALKKNRAPPTPHQHNHLSASPSMGTATMELFGLIIMKNLENTPQRLTTIKH